MKYIGGGREAYAGAHMLTADPRHDPIPQRRVAHDGSRRAAEQNVAGRARRPLRFERMAEGALH